ncbi:MAG: ImmA/IrrE family metallo-endopeptidase [Chloroflexi bacterium]|nr:ImmA/IrrE family metallo-endopeptidase [Chloroflexota bacterium]
MTIRRKRIRHLTNKLLEEYGVYQPPVPIIEIAKKAGLEVRKQKIDSDISGFLFRKSGNAIIGINNHHPETRQRFTTAHELGHYLLHSKLRDEVHIDRKFEVKFRDDISSHGTVIEERESNLFAAEILMPAHFIQNDINANTEIDFDNPEFIDDLAKQYGVSSQAMTFRLVNLGIVSI